MQKCHSHLVSRKLQHTASASCPPGFMFTDGMSAMLLVCPFVDSNKQPSCRIQRPQKP